MQIIIAGIQLINSAHPNFCLVYFQIASPAEADILNPDDGCA